MMLPEREAGREAGRGAGRTVWRLIVGAVLLATATGLAPGPAVTSAQDPTAAVSGAVTAERDACGRLIRKSGGGHWRCTFADNFEGTSLGPAWVVHDTELTGWRWGVTCFTPKPGNVRVTRGQLVLAVRREPEIFRCGPLLRSFSTRYTGGLVGVKDRFGQTYGRFEVRAKWPTAAKSGLHGGFWMNPIERVYGRWPHSGEIDVSEWWSSARRQVVSALHYQGRERSEDSGLDCFIRRPSSFHTYTVIWSPHIIRFFIDGQPCFARRWEPAAPLERPQPFDQAFRMILGMGVGKLTGRQAVTPETELPGNYVIDYVKAWR